MIEDRKLRTDVGRALWLLQNPQPGMDSEAYAQKWRDERLEYMRKANEFSRVAGRHGVGLVSLGQSEHDGA